MECELPTDRKPEPLMGWISSGDTLNQFKLYFPSSEAAIQYAAVKGWEYDYEEPRVRIMPKRSYLDNFVPGRPTKS